MILVLIFTGDLALTAGVGFFDVTLKLMFYYLHERAWNRTTWGKVPA